MEDLIKLLKVYHQTFQTLHRHLIGEEWLSVHVFFGEIYDQIAEDIDKVVELQLSLGKPDIGIGDCLKAVPDIEIKDRDMKESMTIAKDKLDLIVSQISIYSEAEELPCDVISELEAIQYKYRILADYKLARWMMC